MFPEKKLDYAGYIQLLGILRYPEASLPKHHFTWGHNRYCLSLPISHRRHNFYHVMPLAQGQLSQEGKTRTQQIDLFRGWSKEIDKMLDVLADSVKKPEFFHHYYCGEAYHSSLLAKWYHGRVVLIGDAAHPMGSILALGGGAALEDSYVLCESLKHNDHIEEAIAWYELQQKSRAANFLRMEKNITDFLVQSNKSQYQLFISELKKTPAHNIGQSFIDQLALL